MVEFTCEICGTFVRKPWSASTPGTPRYCSRDCKAEGQRQQKPVTREWLHQKYIVEGLGAPEIAALVGRNSKRVWEWLRDYGIPTRPRGKTPQTKSFQAGHKLGVSRVYTAETREKLRQARKRDGHVPYLKNGQPYMRGRTGPLSPTWKGGITPERQAVHGSSAWKAAVRAVWRRDNATCQRCGKRQTSKRERGTFDIHHIVGFEVVELRCAVENLALLCEDCHYWVHSKANTRREFLK